MGVPEEKVRSYRRIVDARVYSTVSSRLFFGPVFWLKLSFFWAGKPETREPLFQVPDSCVLLLLFLQKLKNDFGQLAADAIHLLDLRQRRFPETFQGTEPF